MNDKITLRYPAVFFPDDGDVSVFFPDLDAVTCGDNMDHAYDMAKEILEIWAEDHYANGTMPEPTPLNEAVQKLKNGEYDDEVITHSEDSLVMLVEIDPRQIKAIYNKAVKVNTSIPGWLKAAAEERGINISQTLQKALKEEIERVG